MKDVQVRNPLGKSDHAVLPFGFIVTQKQLTVKPDTSITKAIMNSE